MIIGDIGLGFLREKTVEINNLEEACYAARKKGISLENYIQRKAELLGFELVY